MTYKVAILMGSPNDEDRMISAVETLESFSIAANIEVMSAHRTPSKVASFSSEARSEGYSVIICGAGMAAHLAGAVAANTNLPVIGVPLSGGAMDGLDALMATVQMPKGVPVATVAINGAVNAALLAVQILAVNDSDLAEALTAYRKEMASR